MLRSLGQNPKSSDLVDLMKLGKFGVIHNDEFIAILKRLFETGEGQYQEEEVQEGANVLIEELKREFDPLNTGLINVEKLIYFVMNFGDDPLNAADADQMRIDAMIDQNGNVDYRRYVRFLFDLPGGDSEDLQPGLEGFLWKQGHGWIFKTWRYRYFVLNDEGITYYTTSTMTEKKGVFPFVHGYVIRDLPDNHKGFKGFTNIFSYEFPDKRGSVTSKTTLTLTAVSPSKKKEWIEKIRKCADLALRATPTGELFAD